MWPYGIAMRKYGILPTWNFCMFFGENSGRGFLLFEYLAKQQSVTVGNEKNKEGNEKKIEEHKKQQDNTTHKTIRKTNLVYYVLQAAPFSKYYRPATKLGFYGKITNI